MSATQSPEPRITARWSAVVLIVVAALVLGVGGSARAESPPAPEPAPAPKNYVTGLLGTTFFAHSNGASSGLQKDLTPGVGYGRYVTPTIAVELDGAPTFLKTNYSTFSLIPGVVWNFHANFYAAMRLFVPVDPSFDVGLFPGIGAYYGLPSGLGFSLELNPVTLLRQDQLNLAVGITGGVLYSF